MEFESDRDSVVSEEQVQGEQEMKVAEDDEGTAESALRDNIRRKGQNSYYYAHGNTSSAPAWDGNSEPRLLHRAQSKEQAPRVEPITSYAWADGKKKVTIYVNHDNAAEVADDSIDLVKRNARIAADLGLKFTETSLNFTIRMSPSLNKSLIIPRLHDAIEDVTLRKKADKFVLGLNKKTEFSWYDLKKSA